MHIVYPAVVSALLFSIGVYGVLARRNTILVLMSVELMLNAVNLNLVAFDVWLGDRLHSGQVLTLFVIVIAAAEVGVGLAIVLALYRNRRTVDLDLLRDLAEPADGTDPSAATGDPPRSQHLTDPTAAPISATNNQPHPAVHPTQHEHASPAPRNHGDEPTQGAQEGEPPHDNRGDQPAQGAHRDAPDGHGDGRSAKRGGTR